MWWLSSGLSERRCWGHLPVRPASGLKPVKSPASGRLFDQSVANGPAVCCSGPMVVTSLVGTEKAFRSLTQVMSYAGVWKTRVLASSGPARGAGAGLVVCSSGVASHVLARQGRTGTHRGRRGLRRARVPVGWSGPGTVSWLGRGRATGRSLACTVCVSLGGCDVSCAGVGACVWPVGVELALADVGEAVGV